MRKVSAIALMLMLTAVACIAAPPTLKLQDEVNVPLYGFGEVTADGDFEFIKWKLPKTLKFKVSDGKTLLFTGAPGTYELIAWAGSKEGLTDLATVKVVIGDGKGDQIDDDKKKLNPPPVPPTPSPIKAKAAWVIVVEDSDTKRTADNAKVLGDLASWNGLGIKWRFYDTNDAYAKQAGYKQAVDKANVKLPAVLYVSDKGDTITVIPLPKTFDDIKSKLKEISQ